jgi:hypothetical protein
MSPHAASSLITDLVEMAKSHEELPAIRIQLLEAKGENEALLDIIRNLELKAIDRNSEIDRLHSTIRSLEVARDDAELRFLEADDRTEKALAFVRTTFGNAGSLIQALDPKPITSSEPEPKPVWHGDLPKDIAGAAVRVEPEVSVPVDPTKNAAVDTQSLNVDHLQPNATIQTEGQSEPGPTAVGSMQVASTTEQSNAESELVGSQGSVAYTDAPIGPYSGKRYYDHQFYVSLVGWLAGGGTEESYNWRPAPQMIG